MLKEIKHPGIKLVGIRLTKEEDLQTQKIADREGVKQTTACRALFKDALKKYVQKTTEEGVLVVSDGDSVEFIVRTTNGEHRLYRVVTARLDDWKELLATPQED